MLRQRIEVRRGERAQAFDAVLQKRGDTLLMLALTPFGTRAFEIRQHGRETTYRVYAGEGLPVPPAWVMLDIQRTLMPWLPGTPPSDGERRGVVNGESVTERWQGGRLLERTFDRVDGDPEGVIRIDYGEGMEGGEMPRVVRYANGWIGYALTITTVERTGL